MKTNFFLIISFFLIINFKVNFLFSNWVAKINQQKIATKEFQNYINVQKYSSGNENKNIRKLAKDEKKLIEGLLEQYIETKVLLLEANEKGYSTKNRKVKKTIKKEKEDWLISYFINKKIEVPKDPISEKDINKYFEKTMKQQGLKRKYSSLSKEEKAQLRKYVGIDRIYKLKFGYQKKLEKKHPVKRYGLKKKVLAKVRGESIKKSEVEGYLEEKLKLMGVSKDELKSNESRYFNAKGSVLEEIIFNKLVKIEMEKEKFEEKPIVKVALGYFFNTVTVRIYLEEEHSKKIKVSEEEIEKAFQQNKKKLKAGKLTLEEIEKYLKQEIKKRKLQRRIAKLISRKKEELIIIRNEKELVNIN